MEPVNTSYKKWLEEIKRKIKTAQLKVAVSANAQLIELYWQLAQEIINRQKKTEWGGGIIEHLSIDLRLSFPDIKGFSRRNLYAIRQWYLFYSPDSAIVPPAVAQIPWGHNRLIINKIKDLEEAIFYCRATVENGWSRYNLELAIRNKYFESTG